MTPKRMLDTREHDFFYWCHYLFLSFDFFFFWRDARWKNKIQLLRAGFHYNFPRRQDVLNIIGIKVHRRFFLVF